MASCSVSSSSGMVGGLQQEGEFFSLHEPMLILWHSPESNFTGKANELNPLYTYVFENHIFKIATTSPRDQ